MRSIVEILEQEGLWDEESLARYAARNRVGVRFSGPLALLDYEEDIPREGWNEFNRQCRGAIVDLEARRLVAHPFDKFFNVDQHPETAWEALPREAPHEVAVKYDGSMLTAFAFAGEVRFATRSSFDNPQTRLAREVAERYDGLRQVDLGRYTPVFELVGPDNLVAVRYEETDLVLIGVRDLQASRMLGYAEVAAWAAGHGLRGADLLALDIESLVRRAREGGGAFEEGWVVRFDTGLFVKVKTWQYLAHVQVQRMGLGRKRLVQRYLQSTPASWQAFLATLPGPATEAVRRFGEEIDRGVAAFCREVDTLHGQFAHLESQKDYSLAIQAGTPREMQPFLFARRAGRDLEAMARSKWTGLEGFGEGPEIVTPEMVREAALSLTDG